MAMRKLIQWAVHGGPSSAGALSAVLAFSFSFHFKADRQSWGSLTGTGLLEEEQVKRVLICLGQREGAVPSPYGRQRETGKCTVF